MCGTLPRTYNQCTDTGTFPAELKIGKFSPIYKKKDNEQLLENYCIQNTLSSRVLLAFRPSERASKGILHTMKNIDQCH